MFFIFALPSIQWIWQYFASYPLAKWILIVNSNQKFLASIPHLSLHVNIKKVPQVEWAWLEENQRSSGY
jgi:hypothetical protein